MIKEKETLFLNHGTDEEMEIYGYEKSIFKTFLTWTAIVFTLGFLRLVLYWKPNWYLWCTHSMCELNTANKILLKDKYDQYFVEEVNIQHGIVDKYYDANSKNNMEVVDKNGKTINSNHSMKYFINKRWKYIYKEELANFERLKGLEEYVPMRYYHDFTGNKEHEQVDRMKINGKNSISIEITPLVVVFFKEILSPFYIFQIASCILWFFDDYYYYASAIILTSAISIVWSLYSIRKSEVALRNIIHKGDKINVFRNLPDDEETEREPSENLVPGDIIEIKSMTMMPCDAILLNGNVIVNESMLTGESVPVTKTSLGYTKDNAKLNLKVHNRHILFSGTQVIQTRYYGGEKLKAIVIRTGFNTTKGELIRSILHPKPVDFQFNNDTYKYIGGLSVIAAVGMGFSLWTKIQLNSPVSDIITRTLDIITIVVPPALPGALTACLVYAQNRLKRKNIYCISPSSINICGTLNTFVFDKTGTLTEDGLDLKYVLPSYKNQYDICNFGELIKTRSDLSISYTETNEKNSRDKKILEAMASCHSLTHIHGDLAGDPLDLKMFEFTKWELVEYSSDETQNYDKISPTLVRPRKRRTTAGTLHNDNPALNLGDTDPFEIGIIKQFPFSSSLQRMSVIVKSLNEPSFTLFTKGSPEKIFELSQPQTIPNDFHDVLSSYTKEGYRVIALATKKLDVSLVKAQRLERESLEDHLEFLGLIIMENRLKDETYEIILNLKDANIRTIMCTGDNILTALSVAHDCDMIDDLDPVILIEAKSGVEPQFTYAEKPIKMDLKKNKTPKEKEPRYHFAVDGHTFEVIRKEQPDLLNKLAVRGTVFARMSPDQKQQLIETLQDLGYLVGMCGDGANDCGALKAAHCGISLSDAEASVASPFTSKKPNIECVPVVIGEGRSSLMSSFGIIKFICMYSLTQFFSIIILYTINSSLTDMQQLYIDIVLVTFFAFFFSKTEASDELCKKQPPNKLVSFRPIFSLFGHLILVLGFQMLSLYFIRMQPWFEPFEDTNEDSDEYVYACYDNTSIFIMSMFQYITMAVIFSKGFPYRKSIFTNYIFLFFLALCFVLCVLLTFIDAEPLMDFFEMEPIEDFKYRLILVGFAVIHFLIAFIFEGFIIDDDFYAKENGADKRNQNLQYYKIDSMLTQKSDWPPVVNNVTIKRRFKSIDSNLDIYKEYNEVEAANSNKSSDDLSKSKSVNNGVITSNRSFSNFNGDKNAKVEFN